MKERRYDLDWLRIIAMPAVFLFHCTLILRYREVAFEEHGAELSSLRTGGGPGLALGHGTLLPDIWSWHLVRVEIQARWRISLRAGQAASHPSVHGGSLYSAATPVLFRNAYQCRVSRHLPANHPTLFRQILSTSHNVVARDVIAHSLSRTFVVPSASLSDFPDDPAAAAIPEFGTGTASLETLLGFSKYRKKRA